MGGVRLSDASAVGVDDMNGVPGWSWRLEAELWSMNVCVERGRGSVRTQSDEPKPRRQVYVLTSPLSSSAVSGCSVDGDSRWDHGRAGPPLSYPLIHPASPDHYPERVSLLRPPS